MSLAVMIFLLALLHIHGYRLDPDGGYRAGILGVTDTGARTVTLYEDGVGPDLIEKVLAFEVGHVVDVDCLTKSQRRDWQHRRHLHGAWYAPDLSSERGYGSGDFADVFSAYFTGRSYAQTRLPSPRNVAVLAKQFRFRSGVCRVSQGGR